MVLTFIFPGARYEFSKFFEGKATEHLIGEGVRALLSTPFNWHSTHVQHATHQMSDYGRPAQFQALMIFG